MLVQPKGALTPYLQESQLNKNNLFQFVKCKYSNSKVTSIASVKPQTWLLDEVSCSYLFMIYTSFIFFIRELRHFPDKYVSGFFRGPAQPLRSEHSILKKGNVSRHVCTVHPPIEGIQKFCCL